ncbi:hypothetical protein [Streptomyces mexicanus]|uniref:hypothetical protein n=1 Tax=Streptomyces mexicanus TaxID=178566 RepID=UPI0036B5C54F
MGSSGKHPHTRIRMTGTGTWSVLTTSFVATLGMVVCLAVTLPPLWALQSLLRKEPWPSPAWVPPLATCAVVVIPLFATLCAFLFTITSRCSGGLALILTGDTPVVTPAQDREAGDGEAGAAGPGPGPAPGPGADANAYGPAVLDPVHPAPEPHTPTRGASPDPAAAHPPGPQAPGPQNPGPSDADPQNAGPQAPGPENPDPRDPGPAAAGARPGP